jgi:hypothetical protein
MAGPRSTTVVSGLRDAKLRAVLVTVAGSRLYRAPPSLLGPRTANNISHPVDAELQDVDQRPQDVDQ